MFAYGILDFIKVAPLRKEISAIIAEQGKTGFEEWLEIMSSKFEEEKKWPVW